MSTFEVPNLSNDWKCPICGTAEIKPIVLIGIAGTEEKNIMQAEQVHLDCIDLTMHKQGNDFIIAMRFTNQGSVK